MVGHGGSSAGSYLADPTFPIPSHCASIVAACTVRVKFTQWLCRVDMKGFLKTGPERILWLLFFGTLFPISIPYAKNMEIKLPLKLISNIHGFVGLKGKWYFNLYPPLRLFVGELYHASSMLWSPHFLIITHQEFGDFFAILYESSPLRYLPWITSSQIFVDFATLCELYGLLLTHLKSLSYAVWIMKVHVYACNEWTNT